MVIDSVHNLKCRSVSAGCSCIWLMTTHPYSTKYFIWQNLKLTMYVLIESILNFKLSPCSKCYMLLSGLFPGFWILCADVSEHSVCSIFIGKWLCEEWIRFRNDGVLYEKGFGSKLATCINLHGHADDERGWNPSKNNSEVECCGNKT